MSKFYVGQRVRVVKTFDGLEHLLGAEATIIDTSYTDGYDWIIRLDRLNDDVWEIHSSGIEPILYRPETTTWEAMRDLGLWCPAHIREEQPA